MKMVFKNLAATITAFASGAASSGAPASAGNALLNPQDSGDLGNLGNVIKPLFQDELPRFFAGHRSHSSHGSHGSHRSSSGGGYVAPTPRPAPSPPAPVAPRVAPSKKSDPLGQRPKPPDTYAPAISDAPALKYSASKRAEVIKRLQTKLKLLNVYDGPVDGVMGPSTRDAVDLYKIKVGAQRGGYLDAATLTLFGITVD